MTWPTRTIAFSYLLFFVAALMLSFTIYSTMTVDVLRDWTVTGVPKEAHAGDEIVLISRYTKLRDVDGVSRRYLDCKNDSGVYVRYPLNQAIANRQAGTNGTGIPIKIPDNIPGLPAVCRFAINITYPVLPFHTTYEKAATAEFTLYPKVTQETAPVATPNSPTQSPSVAVGQLGQVDNSSPHSTLNPPVVQPDTSQPNSEAVPGNFLQRFFAPIINITRSVL